MRHYEFAADWAVPHAPARVHEVLGDVEHYPDWWPQVLACLKLGEDSGVVLCRSRLPYTLELRIGLLRRTPEVLESSITGHLDGWVRWRVLPEGDGSRVHFEQSVDVTGRLLGVASYLARPLLTWNHHVMLDGARQGLARHLAG